MLYSHPSVTLKSVTFALPAFKPGTSEVNSTSIRRLQPSLDLKSFSYPCVMLVRNDDENAKELWSCNCSSVNDSVQRQAKALHTIKGGCSDLESAQCVHVLYCQTMLKTFPLVLEEIIKLSLWHDVDVPGDLSHTRAGFSVCADVVPMKCLIPCIIYFVT